MSWARADGTLTVDVLVPPGTTAQVVLPGDDGEPAEVGSGRHRFTTAFPDAADDGAGAPAAGATA